MGIPRDAPRLGLATGRGVALSGAPWRSVELDGDPEACGSEVKRSLSGLCLTAGERKNDVAREPKVSGGSRDAGASDSSTDFTAHEGQEMLAPSGAFG